MNRDADCIAIIVSNSNSYRPTWDTGLGYHMSNLALQLTTDRLCQQRRNIYGVSQFLSEKILFFVSTSACIVSTTLTFHGNSLIDLLFQLWIQLVRLLLPIPASISYHCCLCYGSQYRHMDSGRGADVKQLEALARNVSVVQTISMLIYTRAHHGWDWDTRTWRDVSSYLFTYLPRNYDTPV